MVEGRAIPEITHKAHGLEGLLETPDWPPLTLSEADRILRRYEGAGCAEGILSVSPRPFSAGSVVATPRGKIFLKRHHGAVRDWEGLREEHRFLEYLAAQPESALVKAPLRNVEGDSVTSEGQWNYEVHPVAAGEDIYEQAMSWTPFLHAGHAHAAGRAMAHLHQAAEEYEAPARKTQQLVTSFTIFAGGDPTRAMDAYLSTRPALRAYAEHREWRLSMDELLLPFFSKLRPWLGYLQPLWTHNDLHASNLTWSDAGPDAQVSGVIDFGLADRTNRVHDLATAVERNIVEWLRMDEPDGELVHLDHLKALLSGYNEVSPLSYQEARALTALMPLVHCEFALSETDYFLSILHSEEKAYLAYEGYFLAHAQWFRSAEGQRLTGALEQWADAKPRLGGAAR